MTIKRTEIDKRKGLAIVNAQRLSGNRYGPAAAAPVDRRAQREAERAAGLVPFAVKLPADLVRALQARSDSDKRPLNDVVATLLRKALAGGDTTR
jgi:hypothetical protein